jgi:hypothetical protein
VRAAVAVLVTVVHPLLPWHHARVDRSGAVVPWYQAQPNAGYDHVLRIGWNFLERVPNKEYLRYAVFDGRTLQGRYWQHNPAFLYASLVDSVVGWYPYSGDRRAVAAVRKMLDYQLAHGTTPSSWEWARVPFATSCGGARDYGRCLVDEPRRYGGIETDKVGLLGHGYLRFYELTGERRFLDAAVAAADALARHVRSGDAEHTPWPFRVDARTGAVIAHAEYGGAVVGPVELLDDLVRLGVGNTEEYERARALAWAWMLEHPLNPGSPAWNKWSGFYEDARYNPASRNQIAPTLTAAYVLTHPQRDRRWRAHARVVLRWTRSSFGRGPFLGAWAIDEQRAPGRRGCCSAAGLGSDTARWAAANALLYARTGDRGARTRAFRSLSYATYFAHGDGRVSCCGRRKANEFWFSDGYGDYLRSFNAAMAAIPELAPEGRNHVLGSTSVVQAVSYGRRRVAYRTFAAAGDEVLRLSFRPTTVRGGTATLRRLQDGDFVVRVRRSAAREVEILGRQPV